MRRLQTLTRAGLAAVIAATGWTPAAAAPGPAPSAKPIAPIGAETDCTPAALAALAGPSVEILSASSAEAAGVAYCKVSGRLITNGDGAGPGAALFELNLPATWNRRFLFLGGGGFDGSVPAAPAGLIARGYVTAATDSGHQAPDGHPNPGVYIDWMRDGSGARNPAALADYAYRSRQQLNAALRPLASRFYGDAAVHFAYFMGCSGGGREALIEAQRHPDDFDGFISGDPWTNPRSALLGARNIKALLAAPIPYAKLAAVDKAVMADCDARDRVADGLIQNPAACHFEPRSLVAAGVLTAPQAKALTQYLSAVQDAGGRFVTYGAPVSGMGDLSPVATMGGVSPGAGGGLTGLSTAMTDPSPPGGTPQPWGSVLQGPIDWSLSYGVLSGFAFNDPSLDILGPAILDDALSVQPGALAAVDRNVSPMVVDPAAMGPFFAKGRKLLVYQGFSDTITDPYSTIGVFRRIAAAGGGLESARANARLFMVPGMQHCAGGEGPNAFDPLAAMEAWVEQGVAPDAIVAAKFADNDPRKPVERTMPLCAYPAMARYSGRGDLRKAANWSCPRGDQELKTLGAVGRLAGSDLDLPSFNKRGNDSAL